MSDVELPYPQQSMTPFTLDAVCDGIGRANTLTGFFVDTLRQMFVDGALRKHPELAKIIWSDSDGSGILITTVADWKPSAASQRPALLVKRNKYQTEKISFGHAVQSPGTTEEGNQRYSLVWLGSHTIFALSTNSLQAEALAVEAAQHVLHFSGVLRENLGLVRLDVADIDTMGVLEEAQQTFVVPVNLIVAFNENWIVEQQAPRLRGLSLKSLLQQPE